MHGGGGARTRSVRRARPRRADPRGVRERDPGGRAAGRASAALHPQAVRRARRLPLDGGRGLRPAARRGADRGGGRIGHLCLAPRPAGRGRRGRGGGAAPLPRASRSGGDQRLRLGARPRPLSLRRLAAHRGRDRRPSARLLRRGGPRRGPAPARGDRPPPRPPPGARLRSLADHRHLGDDAGAGPAGADPAALGRRGGDGGPGRAAGAQHPAAGRGAPVADPGGRRGDRDRPRPPASPSRICRPSTSSPAAPS